MRERKRSIESVKSPCGVQNSRGYTNEECTGIIKIFIYTLNKALGINDTRFPPYSYIFAQANHVSKFIFHFHFFIILIHTYIVFFFCLFADINNHAVDDDMENEINFRLHLYIWHSRCDKMRIHFSRGFNYSHLFNTLVYTYSIY